MAEINNFTEINENFDTIKTLLNSIRAQGILNTSDVDKLLSGINSKLEKLNTEEDIDLIKIFLSELKQNFEERHSLLISKFGAIESLFTNLLKNSAETLKTSEVKELFDIVATNLSVFSREVVSQKDALTDIALRIDAMRSDDTLKKDVIKNIIPLKNDLERLNNGFDSIVLSLNENFKAVIKTISSVDYTDSLKQFGKEIDNVTNSTNTILSAIQMLDKKNSQIEEALKVLAVQDDVNAVKRAISDLGVQSQNLANSVEVIGEKYYKLDNLAEKIDASVNIIAGLKSVLADNTDSNAQKILDELAILDAQVKEISSDTTFETFKNSLENVLKEIYEGTSSLKLTLSDTNEDLKKILESVKSLDIATGIQSVFGDINRVENSIKDYLDSTTDKVSQLVDVSTSRTINDIHSNAEALSAKLKETGVAITALCDKSFKGVLDDIESLKTVVTQIDENNVSANNAIFSNITDRLAIFENSLKTSLERQEEYVANSSNKMIEEIMEIKNLSSLVDYKMDSAVVETNNTKQEITSLKEAVDGVLALDIANIIKDLRVDLYASKQEIANTLDSSTSDMAEKFSNDLFGKYELLISRLDALEDGLKSVQVSSLTGMKNTLENISNSIMDVISYVSDRNVSSSDNVDIKLADLTESLKETNLNYIENVRDIVEVVRVQVENNLIQVEKNSAKQIESINLALNANASKIREEIKYSYNKLIEVQESFKEINDSIISNTENNNLNYENIIANADVLKQEFDSKLSNLKKALLETVSEFKQDLTCENADKISELKFASENLHQKNIQNSMDLKNELKLELTQVLETLKLNVKSLSEHLASSVLSIEGSNKEVISYIKNEFCTVVDSSLESLKLNLGEFSSNVDTQIDDVIKGFNSLDKSVNELSVATTTSLSSTLAQILDNFVSLKSLLTALNEKSEKDLAGGVDRIIEDFASLRDAVSRVDSNIDEDLTHQLAIIENSFQALTVLVSESFEKTEKGLNEKLDSGLSKIHTTMQSSLQDKLEDYKSQIENIFDNLSRKADAQSEFVKAKVIDLGETLESTMSRQNAAAETSLIKLTSDLKDILEENMELSKCDYEVLVSRLQEFASTLEKNNTEFSQDLKAQIDDVAKFVDSGLELQAQEVNSKFDKISSNVSTVSNSLLSINNQVNAKIEEINLGIVDLRNSLSEDYNSNSEELITKLQEILSNFDAQNQELRRAVANSITEVSEAVENNLENSLQEFSKNNTETKDSVNLSISLLEKNVQSALDKAQEQMLAVKTGIDLSLAKNVEELNYAFMDIKSNNLDLKNEFLQNISQMKENIEAEVDNVKDVIDNVKSCVDTSLEKNAEDLNLAFSDIKSNSLELNNKLIQSISQMKNDVQEEVASVQEVVENVKSSVTSSLANNSDKILGKVEEAVGEISVVNEITKTALKESISEFNKELGTTLAEQKEQLDLSIASNLSQIKELLETSSSYQQNNILVQAKNLIEEMHSVSDGVNEQFAKLRTLLSETIISDISDLHDKIRVLFEENSLSLITSFNNTEVKLLDEFTNNVQSISSKFEELGTKLDKLELSNINIVQSQLGELNENFNTLMEEVKVLTKTEVVSVIESLTQNNQTLLENVENTVESNSNLILSSIADISAGELKAINDYTDRILKQVEDSKNNTTVCKNIITELVEKNLEIISENIEKETDVIVKDIIEQFTLSKESQKDELTRLSVHIESSIEDYIYNYLNDLKSYLDVKTDTSVFNQKLDNLICQMDKEVSNVLTNVNKMLETSVFTDALADFKTANEILITSMGENLNSDIQEFVKNNVAQNIDARLNLFDKRMVDVIVEKYEEIKVLSRQYNSSSDLLLTNINNLVEQFVASKDEISNNIANVLSGINSSISDLIMEFAELKSTVIDVAANDEFKNHLNSQIANIESLVKEQFGYIEDISNLCCNNLPELTEMSAIVKYNIQQSISELNEKFTMQGFDIEPELNKFKSDIITQFLNIFNQISFVAEQEEIIDFIQAKHSDLITILSHIVTNIQSVEEVKDSVAVLDNKVENLRDDIELINEKITAIISSEADIDYVYSLQDLESDIANLRLVLNEMKETRGSKDLEELIASTNDIYSLVESIKNELPRFEAEEFKKDFDALAEDIVSISTRTNKLILASDESYRTLQDNLHDFKLVINDLDERTRNFAQEAGIDKIDDKLRSINSMIQSGAKTNKVFNQVFEYLAEWVDKAGEQITTISDKVETLDDIGQIKVMLQDLKAEAEDNTDSLELIEALGNVFDKQAKKIASLETKLDKIIVETTISNQKNKIDMSPFEETLNRFLIAIDDKMALQQVKIKSLETKLEEVVSLIDPKDTAQLSKKVGGMDRQIAKLNKSIEKIASHVVEK